MRTINLCNRPGCGNCPEVHISEDKKKVNITDDYGNVVYMTGDEFQVMQRVVL
jgi:hypothetical protein